jgi:DNA-binding beta-propeller fold protein YncE
MPFYHRVFAAVAACAVVIAWTPSNLGAQQTTKDGVRLENTKNTPERPYRQAGSSDPRDSGPHVAKGFGKRDRRLVYVTLPGGSAGGQFSSEMNGVGIVVLDVDLATRGRLAAFDLGTDQKAWENTYDGTCCERPELTPDGKTLVVGSDLKDFWYVIDAQSGSLKGKIQAPKSNFAHNMGLSADGKTVFMAPNGVTMTVGDVPSMKAIKTITFSDHVRPFVINHDATRVYANLNNLLGFEIADVKTGEVIKRIEAPAEMWKPQWADVKQHFFGHGCPSHGIALTPDESEIWVVDNINYGVLVYDNTGEWPVLKMTFPTTASADWITMGLDGQYAFLSSADVVDVRTKKVVGQLKDEYGKPMHSEKFLEMAFSNGKLMRTVSQFGQGIPSAVQARLAGRATVAKSK